MSYAIGYTTMKNRYSKTILIPTFLSLILFLQPLPVLATLITDVRFWSAPDHTRIVLDLTGAVQYKGFSQENPPLFKIELEGVSLQTQKREIDVKDPFLLKIVIRELEKSKVQLILYQKKSLSPNVFLLKPYQDKNYRLVIDLIDVLQEKMQIEERQKQREIKQIGKRIVVIDPGHGGEDPGAIGPKKTMEKEVVLLIGQKLVSHLNQTPEIKAYLTRKGDYFIPLEGRIKIAREYGADLFISLHADASFNPQARGSSVYCLSLSGATDEAAKILADKENMSNILGGAILRPTAFAKDPNLNQILLDLMQNNSMKESFRVAEILLEEMKAINSLKYSTYRQANFIVLKAPDFPSVLVELAYITNREEERLLNRHEFQEKVARALGASILKYFKP